MTPVPAFALCPAPVICTTKRSTTTEIRDTASSSLPLNTAFLTSVLLQSLQVRNQIVDLRRLETVLPPRHLVASLQNEVTHPDFSLFVRTLQDALEAGSRSRSCCRLPNSRQMTQGATLVKRGFPPAQRRGVLVQAVVETRHCCWRRRLCRGFHRDHEHRRDRQHNDR